MLYLLSQHTNTQMGVYIQPRVSFLPLLFWPKTPRPKKSHHEKHFQSAYWILVCNLLNWEKTTLHSGPHSGYKSLWYTKVPWANYVNNGCWQLLWLIFHSCNLGPIASHTGIHCADFHLRRRWDSHSQVQKSFSSATCLDSSPGPRFHSFQFNRFHTDRKILQFWDNYICQRHTVLYHIFTLTLGLESVFYTYHIV